MRLKNCCVENTESSFPEIDIIIRPYSNSYSRYFSTRHWKLHEINIIDCERNTYIKHSHYILTVYWEMKQIKLSSPYSLRLLGGRVYLFVIRAYCLLGKVALWLNRSFRLSRLSSFGWCYPFDLALRFLFRAYFIWVRSHFGWGCFIHFISHTYIRGVIVPMKLT